MILNGTGNADPVRQVPMYNGNPSAKVFEIGSHHHGRLSPKANDLIAAREKELCQQRPILTSNTRNQRSADNSVPAPSRHAPSFSFPLDATTSYTLRRISALWRQ